MFKDGYKIIVLFIIVICLTAFSDVMAKEGPAFDPNESVISESTEFVDPNTLDDSDQNYKIIKDINPEEVKIVMNFQDVLVSDVLDYLSEKAGLVIISDTYLAGRVSIVSKQPLNIDEVVTLLTTVLKEQGYAAIRTGRTLKVVELGAARNLNIPVTTGNDPDKIPEGDDVVTHIVPVRYANAIKLKDDLSLLVSDYAVISSNEASNSLIITDTTANIKRLVKIIKSLDTQMSAVADVEVFLLEYADADNTADLVNEVFEQQSQASNNQRNQNQNPFMRMMGRGGRGGGRDETPSGSPINIPVIASSDDRTNAVVVSGPADVLVVVGEVIKELDSNPDDERELFVYKLKYAQAENIKDRLNSLFQELENINQRNTRNTGGRGGNTGRSSNNSNSDSDSVSDEVYIEADEDTNSLIVMTSSKNYDKVRKIIEDLDVPIPQVLIKVLIAELTTTDGLDVGVEWSVLNVHNDGDTMSNAFSYTPDPTEGLVSQIIKGDTTVTLRALQEVGKLNVLSRPYILTSNNQVATINVGQRYPFITDSTRTDNDSIINTIEYENIGIILEVTPTINNDGLVIMDVKPEITTAAAETVQVSSDVDATVFNSRSAECRVAVPNGSTIVIGGLMEDEETESVEKVPLLGDIPLLGGLFKRTVTDKQKTELLIFLTPQVVLQEEDLKKVSDHERANSRILNEPEGNDTLQEHIENMESVYQPGTQ